MTFSSWINWCLSVIVTAVNWLKSATILNVPLLYLLLGIFVMGVVIRAILFKGLIISFICFSVIGPSALSITCQ